MQLPRAQLPYSPVGVEMGIGHHGKQRRGGEASSREAAWAEAKLPQQQQSRVRGARHSEAPRIEKEQVFMTGLRRSKCS